MRLNSEIIRIQKFIINSEVFGNIFCFAINCWQTDKMPFLVNFKILFQCISDICNIKMFFGVVLEGNYKNTLNV